MSYCPNCGNKIDETMTFCPHCGTALKAATPSPAPPPVYPPRRRDEKSEKNEKQEKNQQPEKGEKQEKGEHGYIGYLIGGLVLIVIGLFSVLNISGILTGSSWAVMLLVIGIIIIIAAIYLAFGARRHNPPPS